MKKIMKNILFTIGMLVSAQACAMEAPPAQVAQLLIPMPGLPADIQRCLFSYCIDENVYVTAKTILALAQTDKKTRTYINANFTAILDSFSHLSKGMNVVKKLQNKPFSLPDISSDVVKNWVTRARSRQRYTHVPGLQEVLKLPLKNAELAKKVRELLADKELDVSSGFITGYSPLTRAVICENPEIVDMLLRAGADPDVQVDRLDTALIIAERTFLFSIVSQLLAAGADPNIQNAYGNTALMLAVSRGSKERIELLLKAGANPDLKDRDGKITRDFANGNQENIQLLDAASEKRKIKIAREAIIKQWEEDEKQKSARSCVIA